MGDGILESLIVCLNRVDELMIVVCAHIVGLLSDVVILVGVNVEYEACSVYVTQHHLQIRIGSGYMSY